MKYIRLIDYIDIILVTYLLYKTYKVLRGTVAIRVFIGILFFVVAWLVVNFVSSLAPKRFPMSRQLIFQLKSLSAFRMR